MNGEGDLSEEFKRKAATVFEAAVKSKVREEVERLEEDYRNDLDENMNKTTHIIANTMIIRLSNFIYIREYFFTSSPSSVTATCNNNN